MSTRPSLDWGAQALWEQLEPLLPGLSVEVVRQADSTNTRLLERARGGDPPRGAAEGAGPGAARGRRAADMQPGLFVAEQQTRGRGRMGRAWMASSGASLTFSLALPLAPADWSGLSLAVGLSLAEALEPGTPARIGLKWPNDLLLLDAPHQGRKLGGVLIETVAVGRHRLCVVGVGLNVLPLSAGADFSQGYACVQELDAEATAPRVLAQVAPPLTRALKAFESEGFAPLVGRYGHRDVLRGQPVSTTQPEVPQGVAEGVDALGALQVRAGSLHAVSSGEVSVRPRPRED
jgi:BirA family biotin operon repressor/biotin-[acetyl-CoA-carboxylase] ligase